MTLRLLADSDSDGARNDGEVTMAHPLSALFIAFLACD